MVLQPKFSPHPAEVILADSSIIMFGAPVLEQLLAANLTAHGLAGRLYTQCRHRRVQGLAIVLVLVAVSNLPGNLRWDLVVALLLRTVTCWPWKLPGPSIPRLAHAFVISIVSESMVGSSPEISVWLSFGSAFAQKDR